MISPHRYAQCAKEDLVSGVTEECADVVLARFDVVPDIVARIVGDIPRCIPAKYHKILREILITSYLNAVHKMASYKPTMAERHANLNRALKYTGNVRESAGR